MSVALAQTFFSRMQARLLEAMACGYCGDDGHNVVTCPKRIQDEINEVIEDIRDLEIAQEAMERAMERALNRLNLLTEKKRKNEKKDPKKKGDTDLHGVD